MGKSSKKAKRAVAMAPAANDAHDFMGSAEAPDEENHQASPPASAVEVTDVGEAAANGEATAPVAAEPNEPRRARDSSPERGDSEPVTLKRLNGILVSTATEERKRAAALEARVGELAAAAAALADAERAVLLVAVLAPHKAPKEELATLLERLATAWDSLERAQVEAAREASARAEAAVRLQSVVVENGQLLEQLRAKEDEAATAAEKVARLEVVVAGLEAQCSDLRTERSELGSQLEAMRASARDVESQKEALGSSFNDLRKEKEMYKEEMEAKIQDQLKELEALQSRKTELEAKVISLEEELSVAIGWSHELELEVDKMHAEMVAAKKEVEKLQAIFAEMEQKHNVVVTEVARLESEIDQLVKANEVADVAHDVDKKTMEAELEMLRDI